MASSSVEVGDWVRLSLDTHIEGIVLYIGKVSGYKDVQYGIELTDFSIGEHNGTIQGKRYFETKDTTMNRGIFVSKAKVRKMVKRDFQNSTRLTKRYKQISSFTHKNHIHFDPITAMDTLDIIQLLGKYWLRYVTLFLPTLDKFVMPRVCKTFHEFVTLEKGKEDTPDPPPFAEKIYREFAAMGLVVDEYDHTKLSHSTTPDTNFSPANITPSPPAPESKKKSGKDKKSTKETAFAFNSRGLNEEEQFLWDELCKTEAMIQYVDNNTDEVYDGRINISDKVTQTAKQISSIYSANDEETKEEEREMYIICASSLQQFNNNTDILDADGGYNHMLWYLACVLGQEHQALDKETRTLIQNADEQSFYEHIVATKLYKEKHATINLYNRRFLKRTPFEKNVISYFLTFQNKLIEIYNNDMNKKEDDYYSDEKDDFFLILANLLVLDISMNADLPQHAAMCSPDVMKRGDSDIDEFQDHLSPLPNMRNSLISSGTFPKTEPVTEIVTETAESGSFFCKSFGGNMGVYFLSTVLKSQYSSLMSLQLLRCNLNDDDIHTMCEYWRQRNSHSPLETLNLAENKNITDAYMDELFDVIANYLGNVMFLMLYETGITDETCLTILNFYKSQYSKAEIKKDKISKQIYAKYHSIDVFKKELNKIRKTQQIKNWKHKNESIQQFMHTIADDYGQIHKYYAAESTDNNQIDAKLEKLYQDILQANNFEMSTEAVIELYERKIQMDELEKERDLMQTTYRKKRSKLKQIRLHLNDNITRSGFAMLNDCYKKKYIRDHSSVILIDGLVDNEDVLNKIDQYKKWKTEYHTNEKELADLKITKKEIDNEIQMISTQMHLQNLSNDVLATLTAERKKLNKEKEQLVYKGLELNDLVAEAKRNPLKDPKRDPKWDKRLMTEWGNVWNKWIDVMAYKNLL